MPICNQCSAPCVEKYVEGGISKTRIRPNQAMACAYANNLPDPGDTISDIMGQIEYYIVSATQQLRLSAPNQNALSKCRGDWFEILVAVNAWNYRIDNSLDNIILVKLPNIRVLDFRQMFTPSVQVLLNDLDQSLRAVGANLTTSNPDILVIRNDDIPTEFQNPITNLTLENIITVLDAYKKDQILGKCEYQDIIAGIGIKTSLRPDRRLQLVYEANILKSIFFHLRMRAWKNDSTFKYFALTADHIRDADKEALKTAATHTILYVGAKPERCVDELYTVNTLQDITDTINMICDEH